MGGVNGCGQEVSSPTWRENLLSPPIRTLVTTVMDEAADVMSVTCVSTSVFMDVVDALTGFCGGGLLLPADLLHHRDTTSGGVRAPIDAAWLELGGLPRPPLTLRVTIEATLSFNRPLISVSRLVLSASL